MIVTAGDVHLYLLQTKAAQQDNTEVEVARCSRGQYFGELALVTNKPRAASVYAVGETKCLGMLKTPVCLFVSLVTAQSQLSLFSYFQLSVCSMMQQPINHSN